MKQPTMQHCDYCGDEVGVFVREWREQVCCGKRECGRMACDEAAYERFEAHEQLDRDMGYF